MQSSKKSGGGGTVSLTEVTNKQIFSLKQMSNFESVVKQSVYIIKKFELLNDKYFYIILI